MLRDIEFENGFLLSSVANIVNIDGLSELPQEVVRRNISFLPGGKVFNVDLEFWTFTVYAVVSGDSWGDLENRRKEILRAVNVGRKQYLKFYLLGGGILEGYGVVKSVGGGVSADKPFLHILGLQFLIPAPLIKNKVSTVGVVEEATGVPVPTSVPASFWGSSSGGVTVVNNGNISGFLEIKIMGAVDGLEVRNLKNGEYLMFNGVMGSGDFLHIFYDGEFNYLLNGRNVYYLVEGSIPMVEIGNNEIIVVSRRGGANFELIYGDFYYGL